MISLRTSRLYALGTLLVILGALILVAGGLTSSSASVGGVVFIGPIPIVFGSGPGSGILIIASLVIAALMIAMFLGYILSYRRREISSSY